MTAGFRSADLEGLPRFVAHQGGAVGILDELLPEACEFFGAVDHRLIFVGL